MLNVYLKPTNFCNVDCGHCYLPESVRANKEKLSEDSLHKVMTFLKEMKEKGKHEAIFFIWHGGEPLVLPVDYFKMAQKIMDQYFSKDEIIEAVQTSLIPYRKEYAELVKNRWRSEIGSSIDFSSRTIKGSVEEYHKLWLSKVNLAREDDILVIPCMTPNKKDCANGTEIYDWFIKNDFWIWNVERYSNFNGTLPDFSTNKEHSQFLIDVFNKVIEQIKKEGKTAFIKPIAAAIGGILYDLPGDRWGGSCQSNFIVINPNGSLNNCPDKDSYEESYGNIFEGYKSFVDAPLRKKWIRIQQAGHRIDECSTCENSTWCKSGCPITGNACTINGERDECSGYKRFINHVRKFLQEDKNNIHLLTDYYQKKFTPINSQEELMFVEN